jgi:hypothetical protein
MKTLKKYLLIAMALAALLILSNINRGSDKTGSCCPFLIKQNSKLDGANK